ncbi:DUF1634 domain-containing protein [Sediminibacterium ginsengisoli]|uniref:Uncharacterized membrane protein n=1 Tax=Sediminibacterium ginsengisoli TaxID=413434 RepID=A0A1T4JZ28_9BACT|nr:DUF1634 domain-containing protein [Sediminibacterium ginsengisoli]SJZ35423.1 Uncharacterized membrane protein [Sediminibacterium ginsengisoli]
METSPVKTVQQRDAERLIGKLLRTGVILSALLALAGGIIYLREHDTIPDYKVFTGTDAEYRHVTKILAGAMRLEGAAIIQLAVLVLIATPILRIIFSVIAFAIEKDYLYVTITLIVAAIIFFGMFSGLGG